jgi:hypothetical protein
MTQGEPMVYQLRPFINERIMKHGGMTPMSWDTAGDPLVAEISSGRWIVHCMWCNGGSEYACLHDPIFYCLSCFNFPNGRRPHEVLFPPSRDRAILEETLLNRVDVSTRNFLKDETVGGIQIENVAHGDRI